MRPESGRVPVRGSCHAFVQPDGGWGLSNAGLVVGNGESLLVDTLFDLAHTRTMLDAFSGLTASAPIATVVNTHGNGDHWFGNELVAESRIVASAETLRDMQAVGPDLVQLLVNAPGPTGAYARQIFGDFDFTGITPTYPDETFEDEVTLHAGGVEVLLIDVGPAHTAGDTIVYCEQDGVVFTGDIVFAGGTPIMWEGPVQNWSAACHRILELDADLVVPGHGPVSAMARVQDMVDYLEFVHEQSTVRYDAGMSAQEAAKDIDLGPFSAWPEAERVAVNVATIYRGLAGDDTPAPPGPVSFGCMAELFGHQHVSGRHSVPSVGS